MSYEIHGFIPGRGFLARFYTADSKEAAVEQFRNEFPKGQAFWIAPAPHAAVSGVHRGWFLGALQDVPLPPNVPRPEMWDLAAVERAIREGFTFLLPFNMAESMFQPNAYWIRGVQAAASGLTVGPDHTPEVGLLPDGWMWTHTFFPPQMVPEKAWIGPPSKHGVVKVRLEIDPDTIDWDLLNRGHQVRSSSLLGSSGPQLGLHTKAERDDARRMAHRAYGESFWLLKRGRVRSATENLGYLQAIAALAYSEGEEALAREVDGLLRELGPGVNDAWKGV